MSNDEEFNEFVKDLQKKIEQNEKEIYSKKVIEEYKNPTNFGVIKNPDATGKIKGPCKDTMKITINVKNRIIKDAKFWTDGCGASIACGNMLTKIIIGKDLYEAERISSKDLLNILGGLPDENIHCTILAVNTLKKCISNYRKK